MIYIRPQKTYKPAKSSSSRPNNDLEEIRNSLDHFKLTIEAAHGFTISKDTPQLSFSVHIFNAKDGSEVTAALAERGFKPTWQLGGKLLPEACITESGYTATLNSNEVNAFYAELTVTIRERDLLLILADPSMRHIVGMILDGGEFPSATISVSERILNRTLMDSIRQEELTVIDDKLRYFGTSLTAKADKETLHTMYRDLSRADSVLETSLHKKADKTDLLSIDERKKLADLSSSFNSLRTADQKTLQGLSLNNFIELSNASGQVTAYVSGGGSKDAVLMAGITDYDTEDQKDQVAIYSNGTGHFGNLYFCGDRVDFKEQENDDPKLSITMKEAEFIESLLRKSRYDNTVKAAENEITLTRYHSQLDLSINVPFDDTRLDIAIGHILCEVYSNIDESKGFRELRVLLDQEVLGRWSGSISYTITPNPFGGGFNHETHYTPTELNNLCYTRYVTSGTHTLSIVIYTHGEGVNIESNTAQIKDVSMRGFFDAGTQQSLISKSGVRFFGDADRYIDVDYRILPRGGGVNPYLLRVKGSARFEGGTRIDRLTLEEPLDAPGCVLAGGRVEDGYVSASFGKYKNKRGIGAPKAEFSNSTKVYTVYHSIGNTNYTPIVTSCAGQWGDVPQVVDVSAYSFGIKFINYNNETSVGWNFNYVCYKGD